jgi:hypothetical protein
MSTRLLCGSLLFLCASAAHAQYPYPYPTYGYPTRPVQYGPYPYQGQAPAGPYPYQGQVPAGPYPYQGQVPAGWPTAWPAPYYPTGYQPHAAPPVAHAPVAPAAPAAVQQHAAPQARPTPASEPTVVEPEGIELTPSLDVPAAEYAPGLDSRAFHRSHQERWWLGAGYLAAWLRPAQTPPLVTTGSAADAPPGALGQPGTAVLFGDGSIGYGTYHGGWLELGFWLDPEDRCSLDFTGFGLVPNNIRYATSADPGGNPVITRPIFGLINQSEAAFVDSLPGIATGGTLIDMRTLLLGGEVDLRYHWYCCHRWHLDALVGFRTLHFEEDLQIQDRIQPLQANSFTFLGNVVNPPSIITDTDRFDARNTFYGANFGLRAKWEHDYCFVDVFGKIAVGVNAQVVDVFGVSTLNGTASAPGGLLALPTNIGEHSRRHFSYVREAGFNVGCDPHRHIRCRAGYSFLAWSGVARPGDAIDRVINPRQVPTDQSFGTPGGGTRPTFIFPDDLLWVHFLNVGVELHW